MSAAGDTIGIDCTFTIQGGWLLTRVPILERIEDASEDVPVANPVTREVGRQDRAEPLCTAAEGPVFERDADGVEERPAGDRGEKPSPGREDDVVGRRDAVGEVDGGGRGRENEEETEEERDAWRERLAESHGGRQRAPGLNVENRGRGS